jgi:hypothetical protein
MPMSRGRNSEEKFRADWNALIDEAVRTGAIRAEMGYAAKKTGFIVTESNQQHLTIDPLKEWDEAVQEFLDNENDCTE